MAWLQILLLVIKYGPAIVGLVREVIELIEAWRERKRDVWSVSDIDAQERVWRVQLQEAVAVYRRTKNRGPLRRLRAELQKACGYECVA